MYKYIFLSVLILFMIRVHVAAQEKFTHTLTYDQSVGSPKATIEDLDWIQGHWRGHAFGGITEEIWSPPLGGSMMCVFKLVKDDSVQIYEIAAIMEEKGTLVLKIKHFHPDLTGWEDKNETVDFRLVKVEEGTAFFDGFTFEKISENEINIYVVIENNGEKTETKFNYKRSS